MSSISSCWSQITEWLNTNISETFSFPPGMSEDKLKIAERKMSVILPPDLKESYAIHNGSKLVWICHFGFLLPLVKPSTLTKREQRLTPDVVGQWEALRSIHTPGTFRESEPTGPIRTDSWNPGWIPVVYNECGDYLCVDLAPQKGGKRGQVIEWDHEVGARRVVASSFKGWLEQVVEDLKTGSFQPEEIP